MKNFKKFIVTGIVASSLLFGSVQSADAATYKVKSGDYLYKIAAQHKTTVSKIKSANNLRSDLIRVGQKLNIPSNTAVKGVSKTTSAKTSVGKYTQAEVDLLARLVRAEANGESHKGKVAVAAVVINRTQSKSFPNTIKATIYQKNQFSPVNNGSINKKADAASVKAAKEALNGSDPTRNALFFYNPRYAKGSWLQKKPVLVKIGNHNFSK